MLKIGITGGIGSGKTTIADVFNTLSIPVYNSDDRAKYLMNNDQLLKASLVNEFGCNVFMNDELNTIYLSELVFKDQKKLLALNSIVHPFVAKDFNNWCLQQNASYIIKEAAILIESGAYQGMDKVILVTADNELRIKRIMERDNISEQAVLQRMKNQMSDQEKKSFADFVIVNNENESLLFQVKKIHKTIMEFPKK